MKIDFGPKLCTLIQKGPLHTDYAIDFVIIEIIVAAIHDHQLFEQILESWVKPWKNLKSFLKMKIFFSIKYTYLSVSTTLPESAVLDGFVPLSKLNVLGLSECGEAVVELAIHNFDSALAFGNVATVVVENEFVGLPCDIAVVAAGLTWLKATAIGLGDESGDDVSDDTLRFRRIVQRNKNEIKEKKRKNEQKIH